MANMVVCRQRETIMEQLTPDDRIAAQEKALDAVNCELALLRQHMDARFTGVDAQFANMHESTDAQFANMREATDAQFSGMRQYVDDCVIKLKLEMQLYTKIEIDKAVAQLSEKIDAVKGHSDRIFRWMLGLQASILASLIALSARGLLG